MKEYCRYRPVLPRLWSWARQDANRRYKREGALWSPMWGKWGKSGCTGFLFVKARLLKLYSAKP